MKYSISRDERQTECRFATSSRSMSTCQADKIDIETLSATDAWETRTITVLCNSRLFNQTSFDLYDIPTITSVCSVTRVSRG